LLDLQEDRKTLRAIWQKGQNATEITVETFVDQRANIVWNLKYNKAVFKIQISNTNTCARNSIRDLAHITGIPQTTVFRYFKLKKIIFSIIQVPRP
jgi:hypothetical protein